MTRTIYIRKMRYEEARIKLEREIHSAFLDGETLVEVVHGIGEGKLKKLTLDFVAENSFLRIFYSGDLVYQNPGSTKIEILSPGKQELKRFRK